jgi:hypothetical protein
MSQMSHLVIRLKPHYTNMTGMILLTNMTDMTDMTFLTS